MKNKVYVNWIGTYVQFFVPFNVEIIAFSSEGCNKSHCTMSATTKSL
jgi:hypothetical protein